MCGKLQVFRLVIDEDFSVFAVLNMYVTKNLSVVQLNCCLIDREKKAINILDTRVCLALTDL